MTDRDYDEMLYDARSALPALKCEIAAQRVLLAAGRLAAVLRKAGFDPDQPRDDHGRWTDGGGDDRLDDENGSDPQIFLIGGPDGRSGYPINILEEDALGGHTFEKHVGKPDEYLKARILGSRINLLGIATVGEKRAGSFTSLEAANKLVNSTLAQNNDKVDAFVERRFPSVLPFMNLFADFDGPTGYEAYAPNNRAQPRMRPTYGVTVHIRRTTQSEKGYYVHSAWPTNRD